MLKDNEKDKLKQAIMKARDKWGQRVLELRYKELSESGPSRQKEIELDSQYDFGFLTKYSWVPGFYIYVEKEMNQSDIYGNHTDLIIKSALQCLVKDGWFKLKDLGDQEDIQIPEDDSTVAKNEQYCRRQLQNILKEGYTGVIYEVEEDGLPSYEDGRMTPYSSVFSSRSLPFSDESIVARLSMMQNHEELSRTPNFYQNRLCGEILRCITPYYLEDLERFRKKVNTILSQIRTETNSEKDRLAYLKEMLLSFDQFLFAFYHDIHSIIAKKWWSKKDRDDKTKLLKKQFPMKFNERSLKKAIALLKEFKDDNQMVGMELFLAISAAKFTHGIEAASIVANYTYPLKILPEEQQGVVARSLADFASKKGDNEKAIQWLNIALDHFKKARLNYGQIITLKCIGEVRIRRGQNDLGMEDIAKAEKLIRYLSERFEIFNAYWNLACCFQRLNDFRSEYKYMLKCLDYEDAIIDFQNIIAFHKRLRELTAIN